ncbi:MAG: site-2 protease family protein, partial [Nitrospirae bacterium]|nr:site-2 protease family protein [Nitrospirota bacterium]
MMISIIAFFLVFTIIILVHELGHFIAARKAGIKVYEYEFSIGFPFSPKVFTIFRHKETEFTLRLLPLGGFVSFSKDGDGD